MDNRFKCKSSNYKILKENIGYFCFGEILVILIWQRFLKTQKYRKETPYKLDLKNKKFTVQKKVMKVKC